MSEFELTLEEVAYETLGYSTSATDLADIRPPTPKLAFALDWVNLLQ